MAVKQSNMTLTSVTVAGTVTETEEGFRIPTKEYGDILLFSERKQTNLEIKNGDILWIDFLNTEMPYYIRMRGMTGTGCNILIKKSA